MMRITFTVVLVTALLVTISHSKDIVLEQPKQQQEQKLIPLAPAVKIAPAQPESIPAIKLTPSEPESQPSSVIRIRFSNLMNMLPSLFGNINMLRSPESFAQNEETLQQQQQQQPPSMKLIGGEEAKLNQMSLDKQAAESKPHLLGGGDNDPDNSRFKYWRGPHRVMVGGQDDPDHQKETVHTLGGPSDPDNARNKMLMIQKLPEAVDQQVQQTPVEEQQQQKPHGILTILLLKSRQNNGGASSSEEVEKKPDEEAPQPKFVLFRLKNIFGGSDDSSQQQDASSADQSNDNSNMMLNPFALFDRIRQHMLMQQQMIESQFPQDPFSVEGDNLDARHEALIRRLHGEEDGQGPSDQPPKRKCVMLSFLRWRTSVYYRTAIHLLFFSGLVLFVLLLVMITMRTCRQRRAAQLRQLSVSTITGANEKQPPTGGASTPGFYIFRLGSLKSSQPGAAMKQAEADGLITGPLPPPAYEQVQQDASAVSFAGRRREASRLVNSLVQAFKARYTPVRRQSQPDNASLPAYDELERK